MKKIGIIGGAGPLASALLYQAIIEVSYQRNSSMPEILLLNYPFVRGLSCEEGQQNSLSLLDQLRHCVDVLQRYNVDVGVLACNTLHIYLRNICHSGLNERSQPQSMTFVGLPALLMQEAAKQGANRLLLLATENSCRSNLYSHPNFEIATPPPSSQNVIDGVIDRILTGQVLQSDSELLSALISETGHALNCDGVILGCSDLPVLHSRFPIATPLPLYDSIKIAAQHLGGLQ